MSKKYKIIRLIFLILFIICCIILIVEAATPGINSANKSNAISDTIAKVINDFSEAVSKKPKITNLNEFRLFIRKLIGHYGAFLIMGIFAALSFMMYFRYRTWKVFIIKVISLFSFGFIFAGITEIIQYFTPDRAGVISDVFIDFLGFITSVSIVVLIFFIIIFKTLKNKEKIDNTKEIEEIENEKMDN